MCEYKALTERDRRLTGGFNLDSLESDVTAA